MNVMKKDLTPQRRQLLERMQDINYGRITNIEVSMGEPSFTSDTMVERQIKFGGDDPWRQPTAANFTLKAKAVELFDCMDRMQNGTIKHLEVKGGLPFGMIVEEQAV